MLAVLAASPGAALAQHPNHPLPPTELETRLADDPFQIVGMQDNRWQGDRTQRTALRFRDGTQVNVKWARSAEGGFAINNQPRYEIAAYRFQKLFLDEADWVVPPTVLRVMPLRVYRQLEPDLPPTFEGTSSVLVVLQSWLGDVDVLQRPDSSRLRDPEYARRLGYLNLLTYLVRHADANPGNVLISTVESPRMFAVDNGVAFRSPDSPRGTLWKDLHLPTFPAETLSRLRALTRSGLDDALAVVAQFEVREDGRLEAVPPTARINPNRGVDRVGDIIQFGLTDLELDDVWSRLQELLGMVGRGELTAR
jgi:hypothetical protein